MAGSSLTYTRALKILNMLCTKQSTITEIAAQMHMHPSHTSSAVTFLWQHSLVDFDVASDDRRKNVYYATSRGRLVSSFVNHYDGSSLNLNTYLDLSQLPSGFHSLTKRNEDFKDSASRSDEPVTYLNLANAFHGQPIAGRIGQVLKTGIRKRFQENVEKQLNVENTTLSSEKRLAQILDDSRRPVLTTISAETLLKEIKEVKNRIVILAAIDRNNSAKFVRISPNFNKVYCEPEGIGRQKLAEDHDPEGKPIELKTEELLSGAVSQDYKAIVVNSPYYELLGLEHGFDVGRRLQQLSFLVVDDKWVVGESSNSNIRKIYQMNQFLFTEQQKGLVFREAIEYVDSTAIRFIKKHSNWFPRSAKEMKSEGLGKVLAN